MTRKSMFEFWFTMLVLACISLLGAVAVVKADDHAAVFTVHSGAIPTGQPERNVLVVTDVYTLSLDPETKLATWCAYRVTPASIEGRNQIGRNWLNRYPDATLEHQDYAGSDYQMGHLAPLASFKADPNAYQLNWMGNVAPQRPELNVGPWLDVEKLARDAATLHGRAMVTVGPLFERDMPPLPAATESHRVPSHYWAIIRAPDKPVADDAADHAKAFIVPQDCDVTDPPERFRVTVDEISRRSGLQFPILSIDDISHAQPRRKTEPPNRDRIAGEDSEAQRSGDYRFVATTASWPTAGVVPGGQRWGNGPRRADGIDHQNPDAHAVRAQSEHRMPRAMDHRCGCCCCHGGRCGNSDSAPFSGRRPGRITIRIDVAVPGENDMSQNKIHAVFEDDGTADRMLVLLPSEMRYKVLPKAVREAGWVVAHAAREKVRAPGYPGDKPGHAPLRKTIVARVRRYERAIVAVVGPLYILGAGNHGHLVEFGHRLVRKIKTADGVEKVEIGFVKPHPFLRPAAMETADEQTRTLAEVVRTEVEKFHRQFVS
ncbi:Nuclease precursor [Crateriforma conspicua]|uniref:Nuclease n=1 Tax=Crateriforma conspicua TaxID=2527996 RepID=A0A5C6FY44_9PLAN|nr:DNA/RNA non-specific endonuclease [Crateriforma conspicua]TWU67306.1 Nuclease precursor [Crateriforma conspicua]